MQQNHLELQQVQTTDQCKNAQNLKTTRGLEALTWMLIFKFAMIIIGLCVI